jgi:hypothetical protein
VIQDAAWFQVIAQLRGLDGAAQGAPNVIDMSGVQVYLTLVREFSQVPRPRIGYCPGRVASGTDRSGFGLSPHTV